MKLRDEKGSTVVESAIIFTVFLLMLFGITARARWYMGERVRSRPS